MGEVLWGLDQNDTSSSSNSSVVSSCRSSVHLHYG